MDRQRTLGFCADGEVKYADVVSNGERMTTVVRLSERQDVKLEP